jgi:nitrate/nitrite transporter NarK
MVVPKKTLNKWLVLALVTLVHMLAVGLPWTVMPVLFTAASKELDLSLGQIGLLWSMLPIGSALVALSGGMLGDRLGFTKTIGIGCFVIAIASGLRGLSTDLTTLTLFMLFCGASIALVFPNVQRIAGVFFPSHQVGLATGITISGFAIGGALTTALSATVIMPLVGSWRNVLFLYSGLCVLIGIAWLLIMRQAPEHAFSSEQPTTIIRSTFRRSITAVFGIKDMWLLAIGNLGIVGSFISLNGYLPVYLEKIGLDKSLGDTMSSTLFIASIVGAIAVPAIAGKIGGLKVIMIICATATSIAILLLSVANNALFWVLIPMAGALTQGVGTLVITHAIQIKRIGSEYAGTAVGLIGSLANMGGFILPMIGGKLADVNQTWPFFLWAFMSLSSTTCFVFLGKTRQS